MPQVKHYGCFQFKAHITETRIAECFQAMAGMVGSGFSEVDEVLTPLGLGQMLEEVDEFLKGGGHWIKNDYKNNLKATLKNKGAQPMRQPCALRSKDN